MARTKRRRVHVRGGKLTDIEFPDGLPEDPKVVIDEIDEYWQVLTGRHEPPVDKGIMTLMEVAYGYFARASELAALISDAEAVGAIVKGGRYYRFRTGELRHFIEVAKRAMELGSRRLTAEQIRQAERTDPSEAES